jgi:hypothetical protein
VHDDVVLPSGALTWALDDADKRKENLLRWRRAWGHKFSKSGLVLRVLFEVEGLVIERGYAFFTVGKLAKDMGLARQTVSDALQTAEAGGAIIIDGAIGSSSRYWPARAVIEAPIVKPRGGRLLQATCPGNDSEPVRETRTGVVRDTRTQTQATPKETPEESQSQRESLSHELEASSESETLTHVQAEPPLAGGESATLSSRTCNASAPKGESTETLSPTFRSEPSREVPHELPVSPTSDLRAAPPPMKTIEEYIAGFRGRPADEEYIRLFRRTYERLVRERSPLVWREAP